MQRRQRRWTSLFCVGMGFVLAASAIGARAGGVQAAEPAPTAPAAEASASQPDTPPPSAPAASNADHWRLLTSVADAGVAVFVRAGRRIAVVRGDAVADTQWRLESVGDDAIMLSAAEAQTGASLEHALRAGETVPAAPAPAAVGAEAVPVPTIEFIDAPAPAPVQPP